MNNKIYGIVGLVILSSITVFALNYNSNNNVTGNTEPASLKIGIVGAAPTGHLGVSIREGYLKEELAKVNANYEVVSSVGPGNPIAELLGSSSIDISDSGDVPILHTIGAGIDIEIIAIEPWGGSRNSFVVLNGSEIKTINDLKGKKVSGGNGGGNSQLFSHYILKKYGMSPKDDVTWVNLEGADVIKAALINKQVDASVIGITTAATYEREGWAKILYDVNQDPEWPGQGINVVRRNYGIEHPQVVTAFLKAQIRAQEWMKSHPDEFLKYESNTSKIPTWAYLKQYPNNEFIQNYSLNKNEIDRLNRQKTNMIDNGIHEGDFDVVSKVNRTYLEAALKEVGRK